MIKDAHGEISGEKKASEGNGEALDSDGKR